MFGRDSEVDVDVDEVQDSDLTDSVEASIFRFPRLKIAILCFAFSVIAWSFPDYALKYLAFTNSNFFTLKYVWVVVTGQFIHVNLLHLLGNLIFLWVFGGVVQRHSNDRFVFITFLIGGAVGMVASGYWYGNSVSVVGASAGIMTLAALAMLAQPMAWSWFVMMPVGLFAFLYLLYNIAVASSGLSDGIAYIGHLAGFGAGIVEGMVWMPHWQRNLKITLAMFIVFVVAMYALGFVATKYLSGMSLI